MSDWKTPEFVVTALVNIAAAIVAILAARGAISAEEGELWVQLVAALAAPVALIIIGAVTRSYLSGQSAVRTTRIQAGLRE